MPANTKRILVLCAFLALTVQSARADQIDGTWCSANGLSITINGSTVTTPGGRKITGQYSRHHFDYVIPEGEPDSGANFSASQLNDDEIEVILSHKSQSVPSPSKIWSKCQVIS